MVNKEHVFKLLVLKNKLAKLENGKCFIFFHTSGPSGAGAASKVFQYKNDKLVPVIQNTSLFSPDYNNFSDVWLDSVSGNTLSLTAYVSNKRLGMVTTSLDYKYKDGSLKRVSSYPDQYYITYLGEDTKLYTVNHSVYTYKASDCKTKSFKLEKKDKVTITKMKVTKGKLYIKIKRKSDGKTGWINCNVSNNYKGYDGLLKGAYYTP